MVCMFYFASCINIIFNSLLAQLVKYDVHTTRKIKFIHAIFITYYYCPFKRRVSYRFASWPRLTAIYLDCNSIAVTTASANNEIKHVQVCNYLFAFMLRLSFVFFVDT